MPLTPQDVHSKVFGPTRFRRGYDEAEVDAFLDEVEAELTRLHREIDSLRSQLGSAGSGDGAETNAIPAVAADDAFATDAPAPFTVEPAAATAAPATEPAAVAESGMFAKTGTAEGAAAANDDGLEQQVARALVLAQRAADEAVRDAETHAEQLRRDAAGEAERIRREAAEQTERERVEWERNRSVAEDEVEQLRAFEREYRTRLRAYLEHQLRELEQARTQVDDGQPGSLSGSQPSVGGEKQPAAVGATSAGSAYGEPASHPSSGLPTSELPADDPATVPAVSPLDESPAVPPSVVIPDYSVPSGVGESASGDELRHERRDLHDGL